MATRTIDNIPVFCAEVADASDGVYYVSLVDDPAVERNFLTFDRATRVPICAVSNEEKRIARGVLLRADFPIYRNDRQAGEYYVVFTRETIRKIAERFLAESRQGYVNRMHLPDSDVEGVELVQLFIKDTAAGINPTGFEDVEDGSLFGEYHVVNEGIWAAIKAGTYRGFSIEGLFTMTPQHLSTINNTMSKMEKFKARLAKLLAEFGAVSTTKGVLFWDGDDDLKAGDAVQIGSEDGERKPAPDGDYTTEDGKTVKVVDGKVAEIVDPRAEVGAAAADANEAPPAGSKPQGGDTNDMEALKKKIEEQDEKIERILKALEAANIEIKMLKRAPAAASAHRDFTTGAPAGRTGDPHLDRLATMIGIK